MSENITKATYDLPRFTIHRKFEVECKDCGWKSRHFDSMTEAHGAWIDHRKVHTDAE